MNTKTLIKKYDALSDRYDFAKSEMRRAKKDKNFYKKELMAHEKARWVIAEVSRITQEETKERIEKLITLALRFVFERPMTFKLKFQYKNNRVYATPIVVDGDEEFSNIEEDQGGGVIDIVAIAFKIVLWSMESPQKRNLFIVDEPFRFTGKLTKKAGYMLKYLSQKLKFQVIMNSHDDELIDICDRVYGVQHNGKKSLVKLIKGNQRIIKRRNKK